MSLTASPEQTPSGPSGSDSGTRRRPQALGDRIFAGAALGAGLLILVVLAGVFVFLLIQGVPGLSVDPSTYGQGFTNFWSYVGPLLFGTVFISILALIVAVPFALGVALFISHYAPRRLATPVAYVIDLLAAVPSVVYGLWGGRALSQALKPVINWLGDYLNWIPLFKGPASPNGQTALTAALVLGVMILPIITAISREVFAQTPRLNEEAAIGLGATRWEVIRLAVFPYAKSGVIAGVMLGLGRALGETMAVTMVYSSSPKYMLDIIGDTSPQTIAANIANNYAEATADKQHVLIAAGLVLFAFTFAVNFVARWAISRGERKLAR
ncbi:phosphate ABC transporter permease subunit PstC [Nocardioides sp. BP30]|uniref:phosphate ABC transporter permease subunit PstC n=1 Tax=Nocardioides sp. BP30 TaxID=3036374 RepID=UPI0024697DE9|nr:phosphate ABC transporter permease subunit PstC [Nocardioides sp. BP30]WGL52082.1 phosphate ABC transporter permease subunit PstC [Nocardioides sp. BP30]